MFVYHGSPKSNLLFLQEGSWVSYFPHVAFIMGLYFTESSKTWGDNNLVRPYDFGPLISFKLGQKPDGVPTLYYGKISQQDIFNFKNYPFEFQLYSELSLKKITSQKTISNLLKKSVVIFENYIKKHKL